MILDIISSDIVHAGQMEFTAATPGPNSVVVNGPDVAGLLFYNAQGRAGFAAGDNLVIKFFDFNIPYGFGQGAGQAIIYPAWRLAGGGTRYIPEFGADSGTESELTFPSLCEQLVFPDGGLFLKAPTGDDGPYALALMRLDAEVSMVNLPASLNDVTVKVQLHAMVLHSKPMIELV